MPAVEFAEVWVTKYALTQGIWRARAEIVGKYAYIHQDHAPAIQCEPKTWHWTRTDANLRVADMIAAARKAAEHKLEGLAALKRMLDSGTLTVHDMRPEAQAKNLADFVQKHAKSA